MSDNKAQPDADKMPSYDAAVNRAESDTNMLFAPRKRLNKAAPPPKR